MLQGSPLKRQLKHLNNRKEQPDRRPRPRASESGGDVGVRARDAGDAPGRVGETRGAPGTVSTNSARRSPSFADSSGSVASVPCSNTNVATAFTRSWPWTPIWLLFSIVQVLKLTLKRAALQHPFHERPPAR